MRRLGSVDVPQEVFHELMKVGRVAAGPGGADAGACLRFQGGLHVLGHACRGLLLTGGLV